jgi:nucleoside-diphosphate-sugar epimerase
MPVPAGGSRIQVIDVERASLALARVAARRDLGGRTWFLGDPEPITLRGLAAAIGALPERKARVFGVPDAFVRGLGLAQTALETLTGRSRPFNADKAREILAGDWLCDSEPLAKALDLPPARPLSEGLHATWDWYLRAGWLAGKTL